jgi:DNA-binding transcriptional MerR regulator
MKPKEEVTSSGYRIGAVSRLTGISPDTLRIWERRYGVVVPRRSPGGGRLYFPDDIARLQQIKLLVDQGDSIGSVATLDSAQLLARVSEVRAVTASAQTIGNYRAIVVGEPLAAKMHAARDTLSNITLVACFNTIRAFRTAAGNLETDILVIEQPTLQQETAMQLVDWITRVNAVHAVVVYRFAAQDTLRQLPRSKCSMLRAPVEPLTVQRHCSTIMGRVAASVTDQALQPGEMAPPRRFDDETLARLATISSAVKCECPRHLAELLSSLSAFERYSTECESRSTRDAALHAYLSATASRARHAIEIALTQVIEAENIEI